LVLEPAVASSRTGTTTWPDYAARDIDGKAQPECGERRLHLLHSGSVTQVEHVIDLRQMPALQTRKLGTAIRWLRIAS
jgi:hypothetical protein